MRILVVDDEEPLRNLIAQVLLEEGHVVDTAILQGNHPSNPPGTVISVGGVSGVVLAMTTEGRNPPGFDAQRRQGRQELAREQPAHRASDSSGTAFSACCTSSSFAMRSARPS